MVYLSQSSGYGTCLLGRAISTDFFGLSCFCYNFPMRTTDSIAVIDKYLSIIKSYYPDISPDSITVFQDGYDHDVLLINKRQVFRFPRTKDHGKKDRIENAFLSVFAPTSPISVQEMVGHVDLKTGMEYQMYNFIPGVQLTGKIAKTLSEQELVKIAIDMGRFLATLHSFPITQARLMHMDELDPKLYWKYFKDLYIDIKTTIFPLLSKEEQQWTERLVKKYICATKDNPYEVKVTHHDLLAEHIIIDEKTHRLNGVIDFSLRIADPARDFEYFDRYGAMFLKTVYENYLPTDTFYNQRRKFFAGHVPVINLYESIQKKDKQMIEAHLIELKEYISQTPNI